MLAVSSGAWQFRLFFRGGELILDGFAGDGKVSLWKENLKGKFEEVSVSCFASFTRDLQANWVALPQELTS